MTEASADTASRLFRQALTFYRAGQLSDAEQFCRRVLEIENRHADSLALLGVVCTKRRDFEKAVRLTRQSLEINPRQRVAAAFLGHALHGLRRHDEAVAAFDEALALEPDNEKNHSGRAQALGKLGRYAEALASWDKAVELTPENAFAHTSRGLTLTALKRFADAEASFNRSIQIEPDNPEAYKYRGDLWLKINRFEDGLASYDQAIELSPEYASAFYMRATALRGLGRVDEARASMDRAIELDPNPRESVDRLLYLKATHRLIELDYPVVPAVRWSEPHPRLAKIIGAGDERYAARIASFGRFSDRLLAIKRKAPSGTAPHWVNPWFPPLDAISLYGLVASRNPRRYVEIGSGMSTRFARQAIADHGLRTKIISIDPHPRSEIDVICDEVIRSPLESADLALFGELTSEDIVFCDNSHRSFQNSDVTVFFLEVLPRLQRGTLVGIHDIFLPYDYPSTWLKRFYNEQYLLACWLLAHERLQVDLPVYYAATTPVLKQAFAAILPDSVPAEGAAFWFTLP